MQPYLKFAKYFLMHRLQLWPLVYFSELYSPRILISRIENLLSPWRILLLPSYSDYISLMELFIVKSCQRVVGLNNINFPNEPIASYFQ